MSADKFITSGKVSVLMGGQFGSEAKGLVAAYIATELNKTGDSIISTTNAGAQAGHTTILENGAKFVCYHLPTLGVLVPNALIYLNGGSIIDIELLHDEIAAVTRALGVTERSIWDRLIIHPGAAVITSEAKEIEAFGATRHLGSTQKGVGAALAQKIMRRPDAVAESHRDRLPCRMMRLDVQGRTTMIEIPQGTSLSINSSGFYPKTTSRECWLGQGLVDAGVHPMFLAQSNMVVRTFPIRVGNIPASADAPEGHSGPFYSDGPEISWEDLPGVEPEKTTVTKRVRRIARWSADQYEQSLRFNRPENVFLTFTNYCTRDELKEIVLSMRARESYLGLRVRHFFSWGPRVDQVSPQMLKAMNYCRDSVQVTA